jgi:uncharacterized protein (TIGR03437 family)
MVNKSVLSAAFGCAIFSFSLQAQDVFVMPGSSSSTQNLQVFSANPFSSITGFSAGVGSFLTLAKPDGTKFYVIANSGTATITSTDTTFASPKTVASIGSPASAATITSDGKRLLVVAGLLHIYDTSSDTDLTPNGVNMSGNPIDVAVSLDNAYAYVLAINVPGGGSALYQVNLASYQVSATLPVLGTAVGVATGPNDLIYVSTQNQLLEVNPTTNAVTPNGTIGLNALPGKAVFSIDGHYAYVVNSTPITGSSIIQVDLIAHAQTTSFTPNFGNTVLNQLFISGNNLIAFSSQTQSLYQIPTTSLNSINPFTITGVPNGSISAATISTEVAAGGASTAHYLFALSGTTLYRIDLTQSALSGQGTVPFNQAGAVSYAGAAVTGSPTSLLQYGNNQGIPISGTSLPIVVRAIDGSGNPLSGVPVSFTTTATGVTFSNASATTGSTGFALTTVTAPATSGTIQVSATAGTLTVTFNLNVGSSSTGTSPGSAQNLSIVAGQGQLLLTNFNTGIPGEGSPFTVLVTDNNNNPIANATVTFTITAGNGSLFGGNTTTTGTGQQQAVITTGTNGQASVSFLTPSLVNGNGYTQTTIQAALSTGQTVTFYVSTVSGNTGQAPSVQFLSPQSGAILTGPIGSTIGSTGAPAVKVVVVSYLGTPIPNVSVQLTPGGTSTTGPSAQCASQTEPGVVLTDATGTAACNIVLGGVVGTAQEQVSVGYFGTGNPFQIQITAGQPSVLKILGGNNQTGSPGQQLPQALSVSVQDAFGDTLQGVPVSFQVVTPGSITLSSVSSASDSTGRASALGTLGQTAGTFQVNVTAGTATASFSFTVTIPATGLQAISGNSQSAIVGTAFPAPLVVELVTGTGANITPVAGATVTFAVTGGSASLSASSATTGSNGQASVTVTGTAVGPVVVTATSDGFSQNFSLTVLQKAPTNVVFLDDAGFQNAISPGAIVVVQGTGILTGFSGVTNAESIVGPLPTTLGPNGGVQITFNGIAAPIYSISNVNGKEQVVVQVPFEITPGNATVTINALGGGTATLNNVPVQAFSPGIFETTYNGQNFAVAIRESDGSYINPNNPAHAGDTVCIFATGLGQVTPAAATNTAGIPGQTVVAPLAVGLNNGGVVLVSATYLEGMVGVDFVCMQVPAGTATGSRQPVGLAAYDPSGNTYYAQGSYIPIQ